MDYGEAERYRDAQTETFDEAPDHGLRDVTTRDAWLQLLRRTLPPPPARVADLGAGTGTLAVLLAEQGYEVQGVDISPSMVDQAVAKALTAG